MGSARPALLALIVVLMVFWSVVPSTQGQGPAGNLVVSTDYELFGTYDLRGGGHVTWTWTGSRATDFRLKLLHLFDEYTTIPRGFVYAGATTNANRDGRLDSLEGVAYTDLLERSLENAPRGTQSQYLQMFPFDLRDKTGDPATSFDRSTSGLAGANASTSSPVEIRFLFEANITTTNGRVPLATSALVSPVYQIFSYRAVQSPMLNSSGSYPGSWPFLPENGWHVVTVGGRAAFWAGNDTTGLYDNNLDASSRTSADPPLAADPAYVPFDLRFASNAWATFNYTGSVRPGDYLRLEYAHPPAYTDWTSLSFSSGPTLPSTAPLQWANATVDLSSLLGQQVRLRFRFHSDGALTASGFYIRDFDLHAPADYTGEVVEADTHYLIGLLSFSDPSVSAGGLQLIRTPGGELVTYGATWDPSRVPRDTIQFRTFDLLENPQILFVVMIAATYAISRLQHGAYERYRASYQAEYRPAALRNKWIHRAGKVGIGILILFYFVPTALWFVGLRAVVSGLAFWFLAVAMAVGFGYGTRASYDRRLRRTLAPIVGEEGPVVQKIIVPAPTESSAPVVGECVQCRQPIHQDDRTYRCTCEALYHIACASGLVRCANCQQPIAAGVTQQRGQVSLRCESCGELQPVLEGTDPRATTCANCGGRLRHLETGKRYLLVARNPALAVTWMRDLVKGGKSGLIMTTASPERLRLEFGIKKAPIVQISSRVPGAVHPKDLDPALRAILPMAREGKGGVILYDGLDEVIAEASLADVIRFLRKANDMAFVHGVTVIGRVGPGRLSDVDLKRLNAEFDEFLDVSAQP